MTNKMYHKFIESNSREKKIQGGDSYQNFQPVPFLSSPVSFQSISKFDIIDEYVENPHIDMNELFISKESILSALNGLKHDIKQSYNHDAEEDMLTKDYMLEMINKWFPIGDKEMKCSKCKEFMEIKTISNVHFVRECPRCGQIDSSS